MSSHDVRDMLDLPSSSSAPRPKKVKTTIQKPKLGGLAREVQNLGGDNPIAIVPEEAVFKKKRFGSRKPAAKWEARPFKNSARGGDGLVLRHWRKIDGRNGEKERQKDAEGDTEMGEGGNGEEGKGKEEDMIEDSTFAKYNVKVQTHTYTDEEYREILENEDWSKNETDYLMRMVQDFDLRWPVIWDRYEYVPPEVPEGAVMRRERTMEDLKARYYTVGAAMMALKKPLHQMNTAEFDLHQKMINYNPQHEKARKEFLENIFTRPSHEAREEESLMVELKRILARSDKFMEERRELYARLDAPVSKSDPSIGPYTTSQGLHQLLSQLHTTDKSKKRKPMQEGQTPSGSTPVGANTPGGFNDRRESDVRGSISGPAGGANNSSASNHKKGSLSISAQNPSERRRLTEDEEKLYGVSYHDRLQGGPFFRGEKLTRPLTTKSAVQQARVKNTLNELGIGEKAEMATADVANGYAELFLSIGIMLDSKKVSEKLTTEINVLREQLEEKRRRKKSVERRASIPVVAGLDGAADERGENANGGEDGNGNGGNGQGASDAAIQSTEQGGEPAGQNGAQGNGDGEGEGASNGDNGESSANTDAAAVHKRSASVLSTGTDKSSKRMKK